MNVTTRAIRVEKIGNATLYLGDCREVLPMLSGVDAVVTDPPYGIGHSSAATTNHGGKNIKGAAPWAGKQIANDASTDIRDEVLSAFPTVAAFGTWKTPPIAGAACCLVWDKGPAFGMGDLSMPWKPSFELIYIKGKIWTGRRDPGVLRGEAQVTWANHPNVPASEQRKHPHQKPVGIMQQLIEKLPLGCVIADPFMGSGTTGVAAVKMGRRFIGVEIDSDYFNIACQRVAEAQRQPDMFAAPKEDPSLMRQDSLFGEPVKL